MGSDSPLGRVPVLAVLILPKAVKGFRGQQHLAVTLGRVVAALVIAAIFVAAGGASLSPSVPPRKESKLWPMASESKVCSQAPLKGFAGPD